MKKIIKLFVFVVIGMFLTVNSENCQSVSAESSFVYSVKASHILVDSKEEADALKSRIDNGERFESLAAKYSKCPSGRAGGDLGYFERGQMVKSFETAAFTLPIGQVSQPVKTQFGWHLIKVYDRR